MVFQMNGFNCNRTRMIFRPACSDFTVQWFLYSVVCSKMSQTSHGKEKSKRSKQPQPLFINTVRAQWGLI
jgi:hypothetical protein